VRARWGKLFQGVDEGCRGWYVGRNTPAAPLTQVQTGGFFVFSGALARTEVLAGSLSKDAPEWLQPKQEMASRPCLLGLKSSQGLLKGNLPGWLYGTLRGFQPEQGCPKQLAVMGALSADVLGDTLDPVGVHAESSITMLPDISCQCRPSLAKPARCAALDVLDQSFERNLGVKLDEKMHVVCSATSLDQDTIQATDNPADIGDKKGLDLFRDPRGIPVRVEPNVGKHTDIAGHQWIVPKSAWARNKKTSGWLQSKPDRASRPCLLGQKSSQDSLKGNGSGWLKGILRGFQPEQELLA